MEHSIDGKNYSEVDGQFSSTIKNTSVYSDLSGSDTNSFTKSDNSDLFYAIHKFSYTTKGDTLYINDTFDFVLDSNYQSLFTTLVNNWAYLNQNMHVLTPIDVSIGISQ